MSFGDFDRNDRVTHEWARERMSPFLDGELPRAEMADLEAHLRECQDCRHELRALRATRQFLHSMPMARLPRAFTLEVAPSRPALPAFFYWLRTATAMAAAAFLALLAASAVLPMAAPHSAPGASQAAPAPTAAPAAAPAAARAPQQTTAAPAAAPERATAPAAPAAAPAGPTASSAAPAAGAPAAAAPQSAAAPTASGQASPAAPFGSAASPTPQPTPPGAAVAPRAAPAAPAPTVSATSRSEDATSTAASQPKVAAAPTAASLPTPTASVPRPAPAPAPQPLVSQPASRGIGVDLAALTLLAAALAAVFATASGAVWWIYRRRV